MVRFLYIFVLLVVLSCSKKEPDRNVEALNLQELQAYNLVFREHSIDYYRGAERIKTTIKAQGGG